jgi:hypothetical protein
MGVRNRAKEGSMSMHRCVIAVTAICYGFACGPGARPGNGGDDGTCDSGTRCLANVLQSCVDGQWVDDAQCPAACDDVLGCVACNPNVNTCDGGDVHACTPEGTIGPAVTSCNGEGCSGGECTSGCAMAAANRSYIGCEYWPVDLDNAIDLIATPSPTQPCSSFGNNPKQITVRVCDDGQSPFYLSTCDWNDECPSGTTCQTHDVCAFDGKDSPFAIVVSNPDVMKSATVTLAIASGMSMSTIVAPQSVATLVPADMGFPDQSLDFSGIETRSYHLTSDRPIIAYQFNPLNNVGVFTNDGSLLIPATAYDKDYYVITHKSLARRPLRQDWNGYFTVVADDVPSTTVTVTPTAATRAGTGAPALAANTPMTFTLAPFQTLTLEAIGDGDLTGSRIQCAPTCGVFAGHEATNLGTNPGSNICCADHLEDQLFPASTWGKHYVVPLSPTRTTIVPDMVRIVAQKPNTVITLIPSIPNQGCTSALGPGQWCEFFTDRDVEISATEPILVGHFLLSNGGLDTDSGDPSLSFGIAVEQYRKEYTLLVPAQYDANYFAVTTIQGSTVMLDGIDVTNQLQQVQSSQYRVARLAVTAGQHQLVCSKACGVEASGWSAAVSYLYAGGLNLDQIVVQ